LSKHVWMRTIDIIRYLLRRMREAYSKKIKREKLSLVLFNLLVQVDLLVFQLLFLSSLLPNVC
jgi:hypothetical protein